MISTLLYLVAVGLTVCGAQVYVDYGNPYEAGEFSVANATFTPAGPGLNPPPAHTKIGEAIAKPDLPIALSGQVEERDFRFPRSEGLFAVIYFVPGFAGTIPPRLYDTLLELIASHGYVVFSVWTVVGDDGVVLGPEEHLRNIQWLRDNTAGELGEASASFDHLGFSCHSSGCGTILRIMNNDTDIGQAAVNIEPVSWVIGATDIFHNLPTINFGAEWANDCAVEDFDFDDFHAKSPCPKVLFEAQNATHCDLLSDEGWQTCHDGGFCYTVDNSRLNEYRAFVQGFTSAFFTGYLQGNLDQLDYVTDPGAMPWELVQHRYDPEC